MEKESETHKTNLDDYDSEFREYTWSVNLELDRHEDDKDQIVKEGKEAIRQTASGYFVNLVTHENQGHPSSYLFEELEKEIDDIDMEFIDKCGCGGYVVRVYV